MIKNKLFVCILFVLVLLSASCLAEEVNLTDYKKASSCLKESENILIEMEELNFSTERINDSLYELKNSFEAQKVLEKSSSRADFSLVLPYCEFILELKEEAIKVSYEFEGLKRFYEEFLYEGMDTSSVDEIFEKINGEIKSERYEKVSPLIEEGYEEIVNVRASNTALNLFYSSTTRGVKDFFVDNWITIVVTLVVFLGLFIFYHGAMKKWFILRKIRKLEAKKLVLRGLVGQVQKDYFEKGSMSEAGYSIKVKKFSEMVRDIDREIPLLRVDYMKIERKEGSQKKEEKLIVKKELEKGDKVRTVLVKEAGRVVKGLKRKGLRGKIKKRKINKR